MAKGQIPPGLAAYLAKKSAGNPNNSNPAPLQMAAKSRMADKIASKGKKKKTPVKPVMLPNMNGGM